MSTLVIHPRPDQFSEQAGPAQLVVASAFQRAFETIGNSYEQLTVSPAPGNGARTVPAAHDHQAAVGFGAFLAQAPMRWQGIGGVGASGAPAIVPPFGLPYTYAFAGIIAAYVKHEMSLVIFGKRGDGNGSNEPGLMPQGLQLEIDGIDTPFGFEPSVDPDYWMIAAGLGSVGAGVHSIALRIDSLVVGGEFWTVQGAEVWADNGEQMRLDP